jgi:hypothetical protein
MTEKLYTWKNIFPLSPDVYNLFLFSLSKSWSKKSSLELGKHSKPGQYQKRIESTDILCLGRWPPVVRAARRETKHASEKFGIDTSLDCLPTGESSSTGHYGVLYKESKHTAVFVCWRFKFSTSKGKVCRIVLRTLYIYLKELVSYETGSAESWSNLVFLPVKTVPQLRRLVAGFPPQSAEFEPTSGHVGFVDKVALGHGFS